MIAFYFNAIHFRNLQKGLALCPWLSLPRLYLIPVYFDILWLRKSTVVKTFGVSHTSGSAFYVGTWAAFPIHILPWDSVQSVGHSSSVQSVGHTTKAHAGPILASVLVTRSAFSCHILPGFVRIESDGFSLMKSHHHQILQLGLWVESIFFVWNFFLTKHPTSIAVSIWRLLAGQNISNLILSLMSPGGLDGRRLPYFLRDNICESGKWKWNRNLPRLGKSLC